MAYAARAMSPDELQARLETLPASPGCYLFKNKKSQVIYVGKARSLRQRVRQYFQPNSSDYRYFVPLLQRVLGDIETVITASEKEAVILENSLIKQHRPKYNVRLRDDKDYLSVRLDKRVPWPRLQIVRRPKPDGAEYFGPFPSATEARRALKLVNRHFQLRTCDDEEFASRTRPCLEYQIKRCPAPCVFPVDPALYARQVRFVELFLKGRNTELAQDLTVEMHAAAAALDYERAARLRDQLTSLEKVTETQRVAAVSDTDRDVYGLYREGDAVVITLLLVRDGFVRDTQTSTLGRVELPDDELIAQVVTGRYEDSAASIPDEVLVPVEPEGIDGVREWLSDHRGKKVSLYKPQRGGAAQLLALAMENARHAFTERRVAAATSRTQCEALAKVLGLSESPRTIECVDISHHAGDDTVGAVVCFRDGVPYKKNYRGYHLREDCRGDDYRALHEVLSRRFKRGRDGDNGWELPDLFVVDGGRGQLGVAIAVLRELGVEGLPLCSLAKERENITGEKIVDRVYQPNRKNPVTIRENGPALVPLARARDEAHRFANKVREDWHHKKRLRSEVDTLSSVGPVMSKKLLSHFGSMAGVREATLRELTAVPGLGPRRARAVYESLHPGMLQLPDHPDE